MTRRDLRRTLFYIGSAVAIVAALNMAFQWFVQSTQMITEKEFTYREAVSSLFLLIGAYLAFTFRRKNK